MVQVWTFLKLHAIAFITQLKHAVPFKGDITWPYVGRGPRQVSRSFFAVGNGSWWSPGCAENHGAFQTKMNFIFFEKNRCWEDVCI